MKKKDVKIGDRVIINAHPFKGRPGVVIKITHMTVHIWCDTADLVGRRLVRCHARGLVREEEFLGATG